jgi:hypothetical protein
MKIRTDFVTNSSSTCYVCEISGEKEATGNGDDTTRQDLGFMVCEKGHSFKSKYAIRDEDVIRKALENKIKEINSKNCSECEKTEEIKEMLKELPGSIEYIIEDDPFGCGVPSEMCPICQMKYISESNMLKFLLKNFESTTMDVVGSMKKRYSSYDEMVKDLKEG